MQLKSIIEGALLAAGRPLTLDELADLFDLTDRPGAEELAGMAAALRGIDLLVFTGGIGENSAVVRERVAQAAAWMGLRLSEGASTGATGVLSSTDSAVQVRVLRTDEEAVIARHTARLT